MMAYLITYDMMQERKCRFRLVSIYGNAQRSDSQLLYITVWAGNIRITAEMSLFAECKVHIKYIIITP